MRIAKLGAHNIKGFDDYSIECGDLNVAAGTNGTNKTSLLCLVTALLGKGNPRMLRAGCSSGHVMAVIESENEFFRVHREFLPDHVETPKVVGSVQGKLGAPANFLKQIMDAISIDPINRAMNASEEEQAEILLQTIKFGLDYEELGRASSEVMDTPGLSAVLKNARRLPALDAVKAVEDHIYEQRTLVNRDHETKRIHAAELLAAPGMDASATDWRARVIEIEQEQHLLSSARSGRELKAEQDIAVGKDVATRESQKAIDNIDQDFDAQIAELNRQREAQKETVRKMKTDEFQRLQKLHQEMLVKIAGDTEPAALKLAGELAVAKQNQNMQIAATESRRIAEATQQQALAAKEKSVRMTAALETVRDIRKALLDNCPIKGVSLQAGVIYLDGIPLSEKNTAERGKFWIRVGAMRAGELGVVCVDGAECFDDATFEKVLAGMMQTGLQWFVGRVTSEPFHVERIDMEYVDDEWRIAKRTVSEGIM